MGTDTNRKNRGIPETHMPVLCVLGEGMSLEEDGLVQGP